MKTINSGEDVDTIITDFELNDITQQPCWFVEFVDQSKWRVGVKTIIKSDEFTFDLCEITNYSDKSRSNVTSLDFAVKLLDTYKKGGRKSVKKWMNNGCT